MRKALSFLGKYVRLFLVASLTLGLAPFVPEPHIWGKLKWVWGGAVGMQAADWFDLVFHGLPWVLLILAVLGRLFSSKQGLKETKH